jgi:hypothetical protein
MTQTNQYRTIRGIDYPYREKISGYMFTEQGLDRHRVLGGRGRSPEPVIVHFDSEYPLDLIKGILDEVKQALISEQKFNQWLIDSRILKPAISDKDDFIKLQRISQIIYQYRTESTKTPRWDKANKLLIELQQILGGNHDKTT